MIPVLFKGNETNFNHNGIGLLKDTLSCEVSEVRNGSFDLELVYPITGSYFKDLKNGNIIQAKPNDTDQPHNFRITEIDKTLSDKEVVVYGVSTTNDLGGNMVKSLYLEDLTPQVILNEMKNALHYPTTFNFVSNITTIGSVNWELNNPLNLIVGEEGSLVDIFGGEVKRTNDTVYLYGRRGKDNVTTIRAGKNLDGFKMTESFQGKYTQILPYFKYEAEVSGEVSGGTEGETIRQEVTVFGSIVSSPYHGRYPVNAIKPIDFSQNELVRESKSLDSLNSVASKYFSNLYSEIDKPSVSINVDMIQLVDSEQYALYEKLEKIELTDTVSVYVSEYDVDVLVKITELKYDSLRERTISIVASSSSSGRTSLMDEISGSYKQFTTTLVDDKIQSATSGIINQILTQKNGSNMYAGRATPPENSKPGDIWFKDTGGGDVELYEFDGVNWVRKMYKGFGDDVRQLVDDKIAESNALFTGALEEQEAAVEQANALAQLAKTTATNASLSASAANQDAQKALADAANAKTEALAQFSMVSQALDTAKTNLQNQVSAADSKAVKAQADVDGLKVKADTIKNDLDTAKTNLQNQVSAADSKAVKAQADANALRTDLNKQAQTISAQAQAQTALTNRVTTVETLADGTKTTVVELSKTVDKATGDITSVTNRTKVVEDGLAGVKTNYTQLSQTVNTQTGQIQTINSKTADLQSGIDGVNQRFENLRIGATNYIIDFGFANINQFKSIISLWTFERISDSTARSGYHIKATCTKAGTRGFIRLLHDLRGTEWQGRKMTYSINIKASKSVRMTLGVEAFFKGIKDFDVTTDWQRFISTADVNFKNFYNFPFYRTGTETWDVGDVIYLRDPQLEDGTVATTPRAAEEDLRSEIAEYKRTADKNYAGLQSTVTTLDDKVTQNKTEVNQTATQLSNRLTSVEAYKDGESTRSQDYFEASKTETARQITAERTAISANYVAKSTYDENVSGTTLKLNEVKTTADTTKQNLATYKETVNSKLTELTTSNQTLDGKITAASTKVDTVAGQIRTEISTVEDKIPTTIGATNYIIDFGFANINQFKSIISLWTFERISDSTARSGYHIKATCTKAGTHGFSRLLRDLRGTEWQGRKMTYSIDIKASKSVRIKLGVEAFFKSIKAFDVTTDWQRFISTDDVNFKNFYTFPFYSTGTWDVGDVIYLRDPQLEDGTVATTPRAAEEDLKTDITSIKTTITQTSQGVEQLTTSLATTDGKVTTAETKINQLIGDVSSKVSQTDYNTLTGRMSTAESSIMQVPNKIALAVEQVTAKIPTSAGNKNYLGVSKVVNRLSNNFAYNESTGIWSMTVPSNMDLFGIGVYFDTRGNTVMLNGGETLFIGLTVMVNKAVQFTFDINNRLHVNHVSGDDHDDRAKSVIFPSNSMLEPNVWTRVYLMYTAKPGVPIWDNNTNFGLLNRTEDVQLQIKEVIMAKSNIPVDYQKADSDIDQSISSLKTSVTQQADQIALKANQTELNNLTGRMSTAEGKITTQAGLIELKAAKTDLTPITNSLNTKVDINQVNSAITAGTQGISQEVTAVKGVLNGGISARNYAVGTGIPSTHSVDSRIETDSRGYVVKRVYSTYKNATLRDLGFKVGDKYTVIFDIYAENNTSFKEYRVEGYHSSYSHLIGSITNTIGTSSNPTQFVGTTTITNDAHLTAYRWFIRFDLSYFNVTVKNFRIFKGEIKQDWYPAWEDQESALEATKSRVDITERSITSLVSGSKTLPDGRTSVFATKIESLEGAITQRVTTQELNNKGYQTATDVTNTINGRTDLARKTDIPKTSGGRNLAQKTSSEWSTPYTSFYGTTNNCPNLYKIIIDDLAVGDTLKSRIVLQYTDIVPASGQKATIWLQGTGNVTVWDAGRYNGSPTRPISGSGEMIFEHEFTITADHLKNNFFSWAFRTDYIASGSLKWKLAKVEKGPIWTAWTPAHEDAEADLTNRLAGYVTNQTYTTYTTARQQTDQQITEQINQTVSKVPTGPVNFVVNGFDPQTISPWTFDGNGHNLILATHDFFYNSQKKLYMLYTNNTVEGYAYTNVFNLKRNAKYTLRIGLFAGAATRSCDIHFIGKPAGGDFSYQHLRLISDLSPSKVVYYTMTFDSGSFDLGQFRIDNNGSKTQGTQAALYICEVSCIEGEYNNSWTPSYDELITEQKFNETKSTVDSFSRAIGTRDETGFVPNIARLVMTQDSVISEVAKYGEHNSNLVQDSVRFSTTREVNGSGPTVIADGNITWRKSGATTNTLAGIGIPVNVKRFISGEKYTLSFEYYLYKSPDADIGVEIKDHSNNYSYCYGFIANESTPIKTYRYFQQTFTINTGTASNTIVQDLYFRLTKNGDIGIRNVMLVRGEKIGPYSTSQVDSVTSRVEQTANSYSVKFLNNANDITTQLNLTSSGARIKSSLIHLDGNVTVSGTAWMDGAIIKNLSADKITTGTLNANNVKITNLSVDNVSGITATYLQSVIGDAFIDWMRGKMITAMNGNMAIDLNNAKITFNSDAKIQFNSDDNALFRTKNGTSAFIHFRDDVYNGVYTAMGVNADNTGTQNDYSSGSFAGIRVIRTNPNRYSGTIVDQVQIVGDEIRIRHAYGYEHDYLTIIWDQGSKIDLVKWMRQFNTNFAHLVNLIGRGDVIKYF